MPKIGNLDSLFAAMTDTLDDDQWIGHGLPMANGERDWTRFPKFGGAEPAADAGAWSWENDRMIVGKNERDLVIVPRALG